MAQPAPQELEAVETQIRDVRTQLSETRSARERLQAELSELDAETRRAAASERRATERVTALAARLAELEASGRALEANLAKHRRELAMHVRLLARVQTPAPLRFLLAGDDPAAGERALRRFGYLVRARQDAMTAIAADADEIARLRGATASAHGELLEARASAVAQVDRLRKLIVQRKALATRLDASYGNDRARLAALQQDRARLLELLEELARQASSRPPEPLDKHRGQLPWPLRGELTHRFGAAPPGSARSSGWFIRAAAGQPVHAVHAGKVVYSDWFRGLGLLVIVDHGEPYLSLYAHNQQLLVAVDEQVTPETPLALAGASGSSALEGVYFELRVDGEPADPAKWLARAP